MNEVGCAGPSSRSDPKPARDHGHRQHGSRQADSKKSDRSTRPRPGRESECRTASTGKSTSTRAGSTRSPTTCSRTARSPTGSSTTRSPTTRPTAGSSSRSRQQMEPRRGGEQDGGSRNVSNRPRSRHHSSLQQTGPRHGAHGTTCALHILISKCPQAAIVRQNMGQFLLIQAYRNIC